MMPQSGRLSNDMSYRDLRDFLAQLEADGDLVRVTAAVDPTLWRQRS